MTYKLEDGMGLGDAARRRREREAAADAEVAAQDARQRENESEFDAAVARFDPLLLRFGVVARPHARGYKAAYKGEHDRRRRAVVGGTSKRDFVSRHEITPGLAAIIFGNGDVMVEMHMQHAFGQLPALLLVSLTQHHWRLRRGMLSGSDYALNGSHKYVTVLSNRPDALRVPPRSDEYGTGSDQRANCVHCWAETDESRAGEVVEELVTIFLDHHNIPYSEVEV